MEVFIFVDDLNWDFFLFEIFKNLIEILTNGMIMFFGKIFYVLLWYFLFYLVVLWVYDLFYFYLY